jgi:hypothetical protein
VLFFFELLFFGVALAVVLAAERFGREPAVALGLGLSGCSLLARHIVGRRVPLPAGNDRAALRAAPEHVRWWSETLHAWSHLNRGLLVGSALLLGWFILGRVI